MLSPTRGVPEFDLADRMRKALRTSGIGVQEMADYLDVARNTVSTWINGRIVPSSQTIRLWALRTGVPYSWLRDGTENPRQGDPGGGVSLPRLDSNQQPSGYTQSEVSGATIYALPTHRTTPLEEQAA
ncbi:MAG TPA: helix-turn-helix transcriptional regulator [Cellulomonadaceae bacterium]|nr:helix-turn-helix transcriptional regulator [Cellulomonadaceae bacterium]